VIGQPQLLVRVNLHKLKPKITINTQNDTSEPSHVISRGEKVSVTDI